MRARWGAVHDIAWLDADHMASWGAFQPGLNETIDFDDEHLAKLAFEMDADGNQFSVFYQWPGDRDSVPEPVRSKIYLDRRPCRFGGTRAYFVAPCCGRRTLRLAVLKGGLMCGQCGSVTWKSRREHRLFRLIRKANKLAVRLGCDNWMETPVQRPLHMRLEAFEKLNGERARLVAEINRQVMCRLARKRGLIGRMSEALKFGL